MRIDRSVALLVLCLSARCPAQGAIDGVSLAAAIDHNGNESKSFLLGAQRQIRLGWFRRDDPPLRLDADFTLAVHRSGRGQSDQQQIFDAGIAAVFSLWRAGTYFEFGTGPHAISGTVLGHQDLSSVFQMGSVFGLGYETARWRLGYRYQHLSNGEIVLPNEGLDLHALRVVRAF